MEAKDLMIGNFVYFNCFDGSKIVVRVTGFEGGIVYGDSEKSSHWCNIKKVEPIPIIAEILEKNFTNNYGIYFFGDDYFEVYINEYTDGLWQVEVDEIEMSGLPAWKMFVSNVHELQHALRLAGIDKEIKL